VADLLSFGGSDVSEATAFADTRGPEYEIQYNALGDPDESGHDVLLTPVPEPAGEMGLLIVAAAGLLARGPARFWRDPQGVSV
jgi:hypothetical protein